MANFNGTRDSNVAISTDNANRKVLILDTITNFDDGIGNIESAEGLFDLGGTDSTSNPTNFNGNIQPSGFYTFDNTLSLDAIYEESNETNWINESNLLSWYQEGDNIYEYI